MARRKNGAPRWRCKACRKDFSVTSGTLFAFHKMSLRAYLMAVAIFCNEVKGKSMLALSRDLGTQYKTAFVLAHKMREAMACEGSTDRDRRRGQAGGNRSSANSPLHLVAAERCLYRHDRLRPHQHAA